MMVLRLRGMAEASPSGMVRLSAMFLHCQWSSDIEYVSTHVFT
jgi:hypothetical protein